jgi:hypothetical protein
VRLRRPHDDRSWRGLAADWLHDWVMGTLAISNNRLVTPVGDVIDLE